MTRFLPLLQLAARSAWNRRFVLSLVVASIALSTLLLLGIERIRNEVRESFSQSVSGTDLIVGARTGPVQLLLYSVFRIGSATNNIRWQSVLDLSQHKAVAWTVPISLGDSHRGFAVLATSAGYFEHFHYGDHQPLVLAQGRAVCRCGRVRRRARRRGGSAPELPTRRPRGAEPRRRCHRRQRPRRQAVHGGRHPGAPGTPVDRSLHISLAGMRRSTSTGSPACRCPGSRRCRPSRRCGRT